MKKFIKRALARANLKEAAAYLALSLIVAVLEEVRPNT